MPENLEWTTLPHTQKHTESFVVHLYYFNQNKKQYHPSGPCRQQAKEKGYKKGRTPPLTLALLCTNDADGARIRAKILWGFRHIVRLCGSS